MNDNTDNIEEAYHLIKRLEELVASNSPDEELNEEVYMFVVELHDNVDEYDEEVMDTIVNLTLDVADQDDDIAAALRDQYNLLTGGVMEKIGFPSNPNAI